MRSSPATKALQSIWISSFCMFIIGRVNPNVFKNNRKTYFRYIHSTKKLCLSIFFLPPNYPFYRITVLYHFLPHGAINISVGGARIAADAFALPLFVRHVDNARKPRIAGVDSPLRWFV